MEADREGLDLLECEEVLRSLFIDNLCGTERQQGQAGPTMQFQVPRHCAEHAGHSSTSIGCDTLCGATPVVQSHIESSKSADRVCSALFRCTHLPGTVFKVLKVTCAEGCAIQADSAAVRPRAIACATVVREVGGVGYGCGISLQSQSRTKARINASGAADEVEDLRRQ